jgi:hypothetical protein
MKIAAAAAAALLMLAANAAADDQQITVPLSRTEPVAGVPVTFEGKVTYSLVSGTCEPIPLQLVVHLDDLAAKLTEVGRGAGLERADECGTRITLHDSGLAEAGDDLAVRVDGHVAREECVTLLGAPIKTTYGSDATLEGELRPVISEGLLRTELVGTPRLTVRDPVLQAMVSVFEIDRQIAEPLERSIGEALSQPTSALELPKELVGFQIEYRTARIDTVDERLSLVVDAQAPRRQGGIASFMDYLTGFGAQPAAPSECR